MGSGKYISPIALRDLFLMSIPFIIEDPILLLPEVNQSSLFCE